MGKGCEFEPHVELIFVFLGLGSTKNWHNMMKYIILKGWLRIRFLNSRSRLRIKVFIIVYVMNELITDSCLMWHCIFVWYQARWKRIRIYWYWILCIVYVLKWRYFIAWIKIVQTIITLYCVSIVPKKLSPNMKFSF